MGLQPRKTNKTDEWKKMPKTRDDRCEKTKEITVKLKQRTWQMKTHGLFPDYD